jgi:hypothetical protein
MKSKDIALHLGQSNPDKERFYYVKWMSDSGILLLRRYYGKLLSGQKKGVDGLHQKFCRSQL